MRIGEKIIKEGINMANQKRESQKNESYESGKCEVNQKRESYEAIKF